MYRRLAGSVRVRLLSNVRPANFATSQTTVELRMYVPRTVFSPTT